MLKAIEIISLAFVLTFVNNATAQDNSKLKIFYESVSAEQIGNYDKAISVMLKNYGKEKDDYLYNLRLGWLHYLKGDFESSVRFYGNAVRLSNESIESLIGITYPYSKMNKTEKLKETYKEILKKDPCNYTANYNLGLIFLNEGDYLNAVVFFEKVVEEYPSDYYGNLYLGWANYYLGANKKARECFERALIAVPNDASATKGYEAVK